MRYTRIWVTPSLFDECDTSFQLQIEFAETRPELTRFIFMRGFFLPAFQLQSTFRIRHTSRSQFPWEIRRMRLSSGGSSSLAMDIHFLAERRITSITRVLRSFVTVQSQAVKFHESSVRFHERLDESKRVRTRSRYQAGRMSRRATVHISEQIEQLGKRMKLKSRKNLLQL